MKKYTLDPEMTKVYLTLKNEEKKQKIKTPLYLGTYKAK